VIQEPLPVVVLMREFPEKRHLRDQVRGLNREHRRAHAVTQSYSWWWTDQPEYAAFRRLFNLTVSLRDSVMSNATLRVVSTSKATSRAPANAERPPPPPALYDGRSAVSDSAWRVTSALAFRCGSNA